MTTICAPATAPGGAIGIIRVSGPDSISIVNSIFSKDINEAKGYTLHYGQIVNGESLNSTCIDDVIVSLFRSPNSYTGEDSIEISHHGSSYIQQSILQVLISKGCQLAAPGEFTQRAFMNGKMDLTQAEAVADLIASQNESQHRVAMSQMRGGVSSKLSALRSQLLEMTSLLELELDFSDHEELEFADRSELLTIAQQIELEILRLTSSFRTGNAIKNGIPVAIIGAPNVGKSTLLNQLLQDDKAIVSNIAGTTRDTIEDTITIYGILFRFIDTAGIRETSDTIESLGIERSIKAAEKAQIIILMRDPDNDYPSITPRPDQTIIRIFNKQDTLPTGEEMRSGYLSALNGIGIDSLKQQLLTSAHLDNQDCSIITNQRHYQALILAITDIQRTIESLNLNISGDLVSEDLRLCIHHLGEILGDISDNEILGNIFSHFCIGK